MNLRPTHFFIFCLVLISAFTACKNNRYEREEEQGDTLRMKYSSLLQIVKHDLYTTVSIKDPWHTGHILHKYVLVDKRKETPPHLPEGTIIQVPAERAVVFTAAHCQLMEWLNAQDQLAGVADLKYILVKYVQEGVKEGRITDCGDGMNPVIEKIIDMKPDLLCVSPFENSGGYGQLEEINIPLMECADYMENSALARAEWVKLYGLLLGKEHEADSLFAIVDSSYQVLKAKAKEASTTRSIITEKLTGSTWYVPGGKSTIGKIIADANGTYAWSKDTHSGSLAMTFETVLDKAGNADVWIFNHFGSGDLTYDRLASEHSGYKEMKAYKQHNTWFVDTQKVPYFEEVSFHPDYLLRDYIILLHPELGMGVPRYYSPVK